MSRCSDMEGGLSGAVVVMAAFMIQVLAFGTSQSIGIYNVEFLEYFDASATAVSLVGAINLGVFLGAGPLASFLMSRWSHRQVALLGASLSCLGLVTLPFTPNLPYLYVFFGAVTGLGNCLVYTPSHVLSGLYYTKHRSLATGIATSGSGVGTSIFPVILYKLIEYYGWKGSLYILAGLNCHLLVFAALLFPVPATKQKTKEVTGASVEAELLLTAADCEQNGRHIHLEQETQLHLCEDNENHDLENGIENKEGASKYSTSQKKRVSIKVVMDGEDANRQENGQLVAKETENKEITIFQRRQSVSERLVTHFSTLFQFSFIIFFLSNILWNAGGAILLIFLPEYMISCGLSKEEASVAFTVIGIGTCIGCVAGGLLGNIKCINRILLYIFGNVSCGIFALLFVWPGMHTFFTFSVVTFLVGLSFGIILGLLVVVTVDLLGVEFLGHGFGYLLFSNGIGVFSGPPIAGALIDGVGNLSVGISSAAVFLLMGGVVMCVVPVKTCIQCRKKN